MKESFESDTSDAEHKPVGTLPASRLRRIDVLAVLLLMGAAFLVYHNTYNAPFVFDDIPNIVENPHVRMDRFGLEPLVNAAVSSPQHRRPIASVSFALNYYLHGYRVPGYHLLNIMIHGAVGAVLYLFFLLLLRLHPPEAEYPPAIPMHRGGNVFTDPRRATVISFVAALLWVVHPLNTQAVTYIVQRMTSLTGFFYMLSILLYGLAREPGDWRGNRGAMFFAAAIFGVLAMGTKETAIMLPAVLLAYEAFIMRYARGDDDQTRWLVGLLSLVTLSAVIVWWLLDFRPLEMIAATYANRDFTPYQRLLTQLRVLGDYIGLVCFPHPSRLNLDHHVVLSQSWTQPLSTLIWGVCFVFALAVAVIRARVLPIAAFAVFWFFLNLAVESSVLGLELMFEHRMYLPSTMMILVAVLALDRLAGERWAVAPVVLCIAAVVLGAWTLERNRVWQTHLAIWQDAAVKSPDKARPQNKWGVALEQQGRLEEAAGQFGRAIAIDADFTHAHFNLGNIMHRMGRPKEAALHYRNAIATDADYAPAYTNLGRIFAETGDVEKAAANYRRALQLDPHQGNAYNSLGKLLADQHRWEEALEQYRRAMIVEPDAPEAYSNAAGAAAVMGDPAAAARYYRLALERDDENPDVYYNYANLLASVGRLEPALQHYRKALSIRPDFAAAHNNMGIALFLSGDVAAAAFHFRNALRLEPGNSDYLENLERANHRDDTPEREQ